MSLTHSTSLPHDSADTEAHYSLEVFAELSGIDTATILHYREAGFIQSVPDQDDIFDQEDLRQLRRIEHLRATCAVNDQGLRLILNLLAEIERLKQEIRRR